MFANIHDDEAFIAWLQQGGGPTPRRSERRHVPMYISEFVKRGWRPEFAKSALRTLTDDMTTDWHEREFTERWGLVAVRGVPHPENMKESLQAIGLRPDVVDYLVWAIEPLKGTCYTHTQLLELAVIQLTRPAPKLGGRWPVAANAPLKWYPFKNTYAINISSSCTRRTGPLVAEQLRAPPGHKLFYHATAWAFAVSIQNKLDHSRGRTCLDFGIRPSFYISEALDDAIYWGKRNINRWNNEIAIVVFALPQVFPTELNVCRLKGDKWRRITRESRMCQQEMDEIAELRNCHMVYGDMVYNVNEAKAGEQPLTHRMPKRQLASKHDNADDFLQKHILGCVFFENINAAT